MISECLKVAIAVKPHRVSKSLRDIQWHQALADRLPEQIYCFIVCSKDRRDS
jgi:hypothetical protein